MGGKNDYNIGILTFLGFVLIDHFDIYVNPVNFDVVGWAGGGGRFCLNKCSLNPHVREYKSFPSTQLLKWFPRFGADVQENISNLVKRSLDMKIFFVSHVTSAL